MAKYKDFLKRIKDADFSWTYPNVWGGVKICMEEWHATNRASTREFVFTTGNCKVNKREVTDRAAEILNNANLEDAILDYVPDGGKCVVVDEKTGDVLFLAQGTVPNSPVTDIFLFSVLALDGSRITKIFAEEDNEAFFRINIDGSVSVNPSEVQYRDKVKAKHA